MLKNGVVEKKRKTKGGSPKKQSPLSDRSMEYTRVAIRCPFSANENYWLYSIGDRETLEKVGKYRMQREVNQWLTARR